MRIRRHLRLSRDKVTLQSDSQAVDHSDNQTISQSLSQSLR